MSHCEIPLPGPPLKRVMQIPLLGGPPLPCAVPVCDRVPGVRASSPQAAKMAALPGSGRASGPRRGLPGPVPGRLTPQYASHVSRGRECLLPLPWRERAGVRGMCCRQKDKTKLRHYPELGGRSGLRYVTVGPVRLRHAGPRIVSGAGFDPVSSPSTSLCYAQDGRLHSIGMCSGVERNAGIYADT